MQKAGILVALCLLSVSGVAQTPEDTLLDEYPEVSADEPLYKAPKDLIDLAKGSCQSWVSGDEENSAEFQNQLLRCINETLESQGYHPLSAISE